MEWRSGNSLILGGRNGGVVGMGVHGLSAGFACFCLYSFYSASTFLWCDLKNWEVSAQAFLRHGWLLVLSIRLPWWWGILLPCWWLVLPRRRLKDSDFSLSSLIRMPSLTMICEGSDDYRIAGSAKRSLYLLEEAGILQNATRSPVPRRKSSNTVPYLLIVVAITFPHLGVPWLLYESVVELFVALGRVGWRLGCRIHSVKSSLQRWRTRYERRKMHFVLCKKEGTSWYGQSSADLEDRPWIQRLRKELKLGMLSSIKGELWVPCDTQLKPDKSEWCFHSTREALGLIFMEDAVLVSCSKVPALT